ncbi:tyrosine-type recombinase/integrase [Oenococcus sp.]|uniref:site-specific integrase n=1 Tax=Oenococcus sp. TaxID=1979414 RepID=UPI0039E79DAC
MASIKKRGNVWQARVSYRDPVTGQFRTKNKSGFLKSKDAQIWVGQVLSGKQEDDKPSDQLLSDYFKDWFETYKGNRANATIFQYENTYHTIKEFMPKATLKTFSRDDFQKFINRFGAKHAAKTVTKRKGQLAASLRDAYADGLIKIDPTVRLNVVYQKQNSKSVENKYLDESDANKLIDYCSKNLSRSNFMILTGIYSGARFGELRALIDSDIDVKKKTISITKSVDQLTGQSKEPKNKTSNRVISMPESWFVMYAEYQHTETRLFDLSTNAINKDLKLIAKKLSIKQITFHGLRHTHASLLLAHDISMQYVSQRLGHANLLITEKIYSHLLKEKKEIENTKAMKLF